MPRIFCTFGGLHANSENPSMMPGTSMTYDGVPNPNDRVDLIAYLKQVNRSPECAR